MSSQAIEESSSIPTVDHRCAAFSLGVQLAELRFEMFQAWLSGQQTASERVMQCYGHVAAMLHEMGIEAGVRDRLRDYLRIRREEWEQTFRCSSHLDEREEKNAWLVRAQLDNPEGFDATLHRTCMGMTEWIYVEIATVQETIERELPVSMVAAARLGFYVAQLAYPRDPFVEMEQASVASWNEEAADRADPDNWALTPAGESTEWLLPTESVGAVNRQPSQWWGEELSRILQATEIRLSASELDVIVQADDALERCRLVREAIRSSIQAEMNSLSPLSLARLGLRIDREACTVTRDGHPHRIELSEQPFKIFLRLLSDGERFTTLSELRSAWTQLGGRTDHPSNQTIRAAIRHLSSELNRIGLEIENEYGEGWRIGLLNGT